MNNEDYVNSGDCFFDDYNIMIELINQYVEIINSKHLSKNELMKEIDSAVREIHNQASTMDVDFIKQQMMELI